MSHPEIGNVTGKVRYLLYSIVSLPRAAKQLILISIDFSASLLCLLLAFFLRQGHYDIPLSIRAFLFCAAIPVISLYLIGFYKGVARGFIDGEMRKVLQLFVALIIFLSILLQYINIGSSPRSVPFIYLFLLLIWLWNSRISLREILTFFLVTKNPLATVSGEIKESIIIYGAGSSGKALYDSLKYSLTYDVIAFIDDDPKLSYGHLMGKKIYPANDVGSLVKKFNVSQIFLAIPSASRQRRREIIDHLSDMSIKIQQLPSLEEIADGKVTVNTMKQVNILDVLDRQTVQPDETLLKLNIYGKSILITGAGGSIGSELCRQAIKHNPTHLILFEISEFALYTIHQELTATLAKLQSHLSDNKKTRVIEILGSVLNYEKLLQVLEEYKIQTVYHAAAYKHVPIVEHNPYEGVINNFKGTYECLRAAIDRKVETFVLISTDKAVRPTNVMGATKRMAELVCQAYSQAQATTKICMVRFGNVLGSSGSVVPLFTKQIAHGGPITVTHPEVTRYFMTIPEAANLVIQAGAMAVGGEVFVLDMGKPVKIVDLARRMIHLSGYAIKDDLNPTGDIEISFTGLRDGEKLYEELIIDGENIKSTSHPLIFKAYENSYPLIELSEFLNQLNLNASLDNVGWLLSNLEFYVEGYKNRSIYDSFD